VPYSDSSSEEDSESFGWTAGVTKRYREAHGITITPLIKRSRRDDEEDIRAQSKTTCFQLPQLIFRLR
jgi:hypothetical protein